MKVNYDIEADILNISLSDGEVIESDEIKKGVIFDYGKNNNILSIEILDASKNISNPLNMEYQIDRAKSI